MRADWWLVSMVLSVAFTLSVIWLALMPSALVLFLFAMMGAGR